ncbi:hypothetical protein F5Y17DRAFT_402395 [Xylariaceae sp. FL0594]|nr:hypothetical protein F5Y17DRAFT_402395 [Xylariaceae sp. FL0594]
MRSEKKLCLLSLLQVIFSSDTLAGSQDLYKISVFSGRACHRRELISNVHNAIVASPLNRISPSPGLALTPNLRLWASCRRAFINSLCRHQKLGGGLHIITLSHAFVASPSDKLIEEKNPIAPRTSTWHWSSY